MKTIKKVLCFLALAVALVSCSKDEAPIVSENLIDETIRFNFPEGDKPWDLKFKAIFDKFDVVPIYKTVTANDFNKKWEGFTANFKGTPLTDEQAEKYADFMADEVFYYFNPSIAKQVMPVYLYMVTDLSIYYAYLGGYQFTLSTNTGFDYWAFTLDGTDLQKFMAGDTEIRRIRRNMLNIWYLKMAVDRGLIVEPAGFKDGINYTAAINNTASTPNYFAKRGFVARPNQLTMQTITPNTSISTMATANGDFLNFIAIALYYPKAEFDVIYPISLYPQVHQRYNLVVNKLKNDYNIDLQKIATGTK
ncbi:hypothetical protein [Pedobacter sp. MW01-1-1]|uniref:hypothetical protein n=1 Tax=Pedobacter sp. MW01-1-1 TaxID=3383027 RepID=UPI003FEE5FEB